jgi:hypothetical protein
MDIKSLLQQKLDENLNFQQIILTNITNETNDEESVLKSRELECNSHNYIRLEELIKNPKSNFEQCTLDNCKQERLDKLQKQLKDINNDIITIKQLLQ